ncbi:uncharacterized protein LOC131332670 [Rhododendron vialii]|uniref:uncharacterized protein LOC131332670 n=1 Tax=Rhododendron vialii TaxID=182163 RepID=UPI00265FEAD7|nr:uncharacterized protein LOC131332670 [Rhododendron vialii]
MSRNALLNFLLLDSDDDDLEILTVIAMEEERLKSEREVVLHHGSVQGRKYIDRGTILGHERIFRDYFAEPPAYPPEYFRRRFRMSRSLFLRIQAAIEAHDPYFVQTRNVARKLGLSSLQKMTTAIRILAYGVSADFLDEIVRIGESTTLESLKRFVIAVIEIFSDEYLRSPTSDDIARLLVVGERRRFPGMLGSIDCVHWKWKNCSTAWKGMYSGHIREPTVILEAVASYDRWIWHSYFGLPGGNNDINVLKRSSVFTELAQGCAPPANYSINGHNYTMGYYLADVIRQPARFWGHSMLKVVMKACIIMHNMIIEDEREDDAQDFEYERDDGPLPEPVSHEHTTELMEFIRRQHVIRNRETHSQLQSDLVEHLWERHSQS